MKVRTAICLCWSLWAAGAVPLLRAQAPPSGEKRVQLRLVSATPRDSVVMMTGGSLLQKTPKTGNWLVVTLEATVPREGFEAAPRLGGAGISAPRQPAGISGDSAPAPDAQFLEYAARPSFVPMVHIAGAGHAGWVGLTKKDGSYGGAGYLGADDKLHFMITNAPRLRFEKTGPTVVTLVFDVAGGQGAYSLSLGDATLDVRPGPRSGAAR